MVSGGRLRPNTATDSTAAETVAAPPAKWQKLSDKTAETAADNTVPDTVADHPMPDAVDTADITSRIAAAYADDPVVSGEKRTKHWVFTDNLWWDHEEIPVPDNKALKKMIMHDFLILPMLDILVYKKLSRMSQGTSTGLTFGLKLMITSKTAPAVKSTRASLKSLKV